MLIREVDDSNINIQKLVALSQFLISRANDTGAQKKIATQTFLQLAANQGISLTVDRLKDLSTKSSLNNLIQNVQGDANGEIIFMGDEAVTDTMTVDQARKTVDTMERAAKKGL